MARKQGTGSGIFIEKNGRSIELLKTRSFVEISGTLVPFEELSQEQKNYVMTRVQINGCHAYYYGKELEERPVKPQAAFEEVFADRILTGGGVADI